MNKWLVAALALVSVLGASLTMAALEDEIRERLEAPGQVCVIGTECAAGLSIAGSGSDGPLEPEEVYQTYCFACHGTGANNAPVYGNAEAWAPRLEKGMDTLFDSLQNGFNNGAMPPKGLCMNCSEDDLHAVLDYMLEPVQ